MLLKRIFKVNRTTAIINRMFWAKHEDSPAIIQSAKDRLKLYKPNKHENDDHNTVITVKEIQEGIKKNNPFDDPEIDRIINLKPGDPERNKFYCGISDVKSEDHQVIKKVKKSIRKLIDQEIEFLKFQDQLKAEERESLLSEAANEVETRKSFYYKYDSKKVYDIHAPGNIFKKQSIALPHEHIHPQHHIDAKSLTESDLQEMYGLYTYLIDLHISQVRRDVKDKNYIPPQFNQLSITEPNFHEHTIDNKFFEFYHRWREPTRTWKSQTQEIDYQKELDALPVNHHPDHRATTHNDVEWRSEQKFPHVANRKGYPIMAESPLEKITGIERAPAHPSYQLQAFVQTPSMDPDPTLNFEKAETVYENYRIGEWIRMWRWTAGIILPFWPAFFTFEIYQADGPPSLQWLADYGFNHQIPLQFQDSGDYNLKKMRYCDEHDYMSLAYIFKRMMLRPTHTFYQLIVLALLQNLSFNYVTKMVYNKDRDLVFVYKPDGIFSDKEYTVFDAVQSPVNLEESLF